MQAPDESTEIRWIELATVDSTNAEAMRRAAGGDVRDLYIRADQQTAGRGRAERSWQTRCGNLALTRLMTLDCPPAAVAQLALVAGLGVHQMVAGVTGEAGREAAVAIKWPNDVLISGAKVAGVLVETTTFGRQAFAVIGMGVNVARAPVIPGRATVSLADVVSDVPDVGVLGRRLATALEDWLRMWDSGRGFPAIRAAWLERSLPVATAISVNAGGATVTGRFAGIDADGTLLLRDQAGNLRRFAFGDVNIVSASQSGGRSSEASEAR